MGIVSPDEAINSILRSEVDLAVAFNLKPQRDLNVIWSTNLLLGL